MSPQNRIVKDISEFWDDKIFFDLDDVGEKMLRKKIEIFSRKKHKSEHSIVNSLLKKSLEKVA